MERIIKKLNDLLQKEKDIYIENSMIAYNALPDSPIPDIESNLSMIIELHTAINVLNNHMKTENLVSQR